MEKIFLSVLNMSLTASFVILVIVPTRLLLKKAPKIISYALWAIAGFRLVFPFTIEGMFSLIPFKSAPIPQDIAVQIIPRIDSGINVIDNAVSVALPAAAFGASTNPLQVWITISSYIWLFGIIAMLIYSFASIILLKKKLRGASSIGHNLYESGRLRTPFVIGLFKPEIYIPTELTDEERRYIVLHERTHIRRLDHVVKMFAYLVLCLHWFNPLAWVAFSLMGADMEMSCDERVVKELGGDIKNAYSLSLVRVAAGHKILNGSPLAFGEGGMKSRIKNVLNFRRPSRVIVAVSVVLTLILGVGFAMNRAQDSPPWTNVPQKFDWPVRDMTFDRITFGGDRELIVYRMGKEPDSETIYSDGSSVISYYRSPQYGAELKTELAELETEFMDLPGSDIYVKFYLNNPEIIEKKGISGVWRIDVVGRCEMAGRSSEEADGTLSGLLAQYGRPNAVERGSDNYIIWYLRPDDNNKRMWFEVKENELTYRMGIVCSYDDENEARAWEAGKWYAIPIEDRRLTGLSMDIYLSDENGDMIEKSIDLLDAAERAASAPMSPDGHFLHISAWMT
ncbi:MAG: M56 family metallopeptidase [Clostridiales Family XIII bacterium]|jgi:beta-lactamase regulating signal transducer with metallopeptidase domain|nr:M56 family metallopeptidase [Clostridiales Family XIII bacterium]